MRSTYTHARTRAGAIRRMNMEPTYEKPAGFDTLESWLAWVDVNVGKGHGPKPYTSPDGRLVWVVKHANNINAQYAWVCYWLADVEEMVQHAAVVNKWGAK